ncbi:MAG: ABC transporter ATP-binding protein [Steroidobacteraceae bacterium]|nr:ABC transporter ATP-binding protein [Steroidobacteraceae bacterium]MDW8259315.1 ABC transporter ATP-binding protein [Gammaproteobacteria bacterium]
MIELQSVHRRFQVGDQIVAALDDVSLTIAGGEYLSVMGPSGSGKSTLLNVLGLLDKPTAGIYRLNGTDTTRLSDDEQAKVRSAQVGFIFQIFHLVPRLTALENVALPMLLAGIPPKVRMARAAELIASVGLTDRAHHRPEQLSGGQRQRVAIARAMVMRPTLLLADEPTGNLDTASGRDVVELLERLNRDGYTLIIVTHDPAIGERARRRIKMRDGKIVDDARS